MNPPETHAPSQPEIPPNFLKASSLKATEGNLLPQGGSKQIQISNNKCYMIHASFWKKTSTFNATDVQTKNKRGVGWGLPDGTSPKNLDPKNDGLPSVSTAGIYFSGVCFQVPLSQRGSLVLKKKRQRLGSPLS